MNYISFLDNGRAAYGLLVDGTQVVDLSKVFGADAPDLKSLLTRGLGNEALNRGQYTNHTLPLAALRLLPVIPNPGKIVCVGLNYGDHVQETAREPTEHPALFLRVAESQVAHGEPLLLPPESSRLDYEGEIAVVIGTAGRRISRAAAWQHIAGFACYNDGSIRDWQSATSQWTAGKNFWRTGAFGPWLVPTSHIDPDFTMTLVTRLNGVEMQRSSTDRLIHSIPSLLAYISTIMPLSPGDVIVTGTPGGVGSRRTPPVFLTCGDVIEVEVDAIGVLRNTVAYEPLTS